MIDYVVGFLFSNDLSKVVLIQKERPDWQRGRLNGVGGHVEEGEELVEAMLREFKEETGHYIGSWIKFVELVSYKWRVHFFKARGNTNKVKSITDEKVFVCDSNQLPPRVLSNLRWLIPLAHDKEIIFPLKMAARLKGAE